MTLLTPIWLLLLIPLGLSLWVWRPPTTLLTVLRGVSLLCVVLALANIAIRLPSRAGTVVVVADRSLSMPEDSGTEEKKVIDLVRESMSGDDRLAVVGFGKEVAVELAPGFAKFGGFQHEVGGTGSSLAEGIERALALVPADTPGRLLVLSDGKWTGKDPSPMAAAALARNVAIDYRALERPAAGDLAVARVDAPALVSVGESYLITGWVQAPTAQTIEFVLRRGDTVLSTGTRAVPSGMTRLTFRDRATLAGNQAYTLVIRPVATGATEAEKDPIPQNNLARFLVGVTGPKPILHVSDNAKSGLARLLRSGGLDVRSPRPQEISWKLEDLSRYSAVLLENLPAEKIGHNGMETLASWVRETGGGLMMTGGQASYGPGGYYKSPIDPILPVSMELRNEHRKLSLAIVVALDRSGSMAVPVPGGKVKMDLANLGAAQVLDLMGPMDEFGCLAIDSEVHTIAPLAKIDQKDKIRRQILKIESMGGGIFVYKALAGAAEMLLKAKAGTRHIILFSDAADSEEPGAYKELLEKTEKAGITVSVIGLGSERDVDAELLKDIAKRGKGRIFFTDKPEELPRLFAQDTFVVARNTFLDEPVGVRHMAGLSTLIERQLPATRLMIGGYNLCYQRPGATLGTITEDEYKAPVVSAWRAGSGRVVCYTGEADGKFAGGMASWAQVGEFYTSLMRWTAGTANPLRDNMLLTQEVREGVNLVQLHLDPERKAESFAGLPRVATLRSMSGEPPRTDRTALRWTGADTLAIEIPVDGGETSLTTIEVPGFDPVALPPVCLPYSPEFRPVQRDRGQVTLERLARSTGGIERLDPHNIWKDLPRHVRYLSVARWLLLAAVVLLLAEVLERRTGLLTGMFRRTKIEEQAEEEEEPLGNRPLATKAVAGKGSKLVIAPTLVEAGEQIPIPTTDTAEPAGVVAAIRKARKQLQQRKE